MPSLDAAICVACGNGLPHVLRSGYRRCHDCVEADRPHSVVFARLVRAARWQEIHGLGDYDPAGAAAA